MKMKESMDQVQWLMQHVGGTLWMPGKAGARPWTLEGVIAERGPFPFNISLVAKDGAGDEYFFQVKDLNDKLFRTQAEAEQAYKAS